MSDDILEKTLKYERLLELRHQKREMLEKAFIPSMPEAVPFQQQIDFFKDKSLQKLLRCGNRAAKTFTSMRDLAWKLMRIHPYREEWNYTTAMRSYHDSQPKTIWVCAPTYDFIMETIWGMYLSKFIPEWYYQNKEGSPNIDYVQNDRSKIARITFRNGDRVEFKSYSQSDLAIMGRVVDEIYLDEMPPRPLIISEYVTRTLDVDGSVCLSFTPLVENEEIRAYLDTKVEDGILSLHSWSILANPHYSQNPERLARALAEWDHLPEGEKNARLNGDWYYETRHGKVFSDCLIPTCRDFEVPAHWRRARVVDPAAHLSGCCFFAENPDTGVWYGYLSVQLGTKSTTVDANYIAQEILSYDSNDFCLSIYDNAEAWFGASDLARQMKFQPCIQKSVNSAIVTTKQRLNEGRIILFETGFGLGLAQLRDYEWGPAGKPKNKHKYHALDCLFYFSRQIPERISSKGLADNFPGESEIALRRLAKQAKTTQTQVRKVTPTYRPSLRLASRRSR